MAFVIRFVKGVRNHWKKSTFFTLAVAYGVNYTKEYYQTQELMKAYCLEAQKFGDQSIPDGISPRNITVILNPSANRRKAAKQFEKYCAPILHMAGICVDIKLTESEGHARTLVENIVQTDAIIVAGGDGTISEVITGLFRRIGNDRIENPCPIGILPLGRTNTIGKVLFPGGETLANVKSLADASMAIVEESTKNVDVMKIEIIEETVVEQPEEKKQILDIKTVHDKENQENLRKLTNENLRKLANENLSEKNKIVKNIEQTENTNQLEYEKGKIVENNEQTEITKLTENESNKIENETVNELVSNEVENSEPKQEKTEPKQEKSEPKQEKTEEMESEKMTEPLKPVYALATFEWGAYRDAHAKQDKYWYWGSLRKYATYIFNGYKSNLTWDCCADLNYLEPCTGCSNCYIQPEIRKAQTRWWSRFFSFQKPIPKTEIDYTKILNERCGMQHHKEIVTSDFTLTTVNAFNNPSMSQLQLNIGPESTPYFDFVSQGFKSLKGENRQIAETIETRQIEIIPKKLDSSQEVWFSIDKEEYEVRPVRITLLPRVLKVFCRQQKNI